MDYSFVLGILGALVVAFLIRPFLFRGSTAIAPAEAKKLVQDGALLVDVRSAAEYAQGSLPKAKNIPLQELPKRLREFGPTDRTIILCCQTGTRSAIAANALKRAGYTSVFNLGSWRRWLQAPNE